MKTINQILGLLNRVLPAGSRPTVTVPPPQPAAVAAPMFQPPAPAQQLRATGLRPTSLKPSQLIELARGATVFPFHLEATWVSAKQFVVEVLCWEFLGGRLEPLAAFTGDPKNEVATQVQPAQIDDRGYYAVLQISHNEVNGTWWRRGTIPRNGRRQNIKFSGWTRAWQDAKPDGLDTVVGLTATLALATMQIQERPETDEEWAIRRMRISQQQAQERQRRGLPGIQANGPRPMQQRRPAAQPPQRQRTEKPRYHMV